MEMYRSRVTGRTQYKFHWESEMEALVGMMGKHLGEHYWDVLVRVEQLELVN